MRSTLRGYYRFSGSTSNARDHLRHNHTDAFAPKSHRQTTLLQAGVAKKLKDTDPLKQVHDLKLLKLVTRRNLPLSIVESREFIEYSESLKPSYSVPCRKTLSKMLYHRTEIVAERLRQELKSAWAMSFTCDGWTQHRRYFLGITVHRITRCGQMKASILPMVHMREKHNSDNLLIRLKETVSKFLKNDWPEDRIGGITTDTASNMVKLGEDIDMFWAPCFAHVLNLFIRDVFDLPEIKVLLDSLRAVVKLFRETDDYIRALRTVQQDSKSPERALVLDVPTRWNSTYYMCDMAVKEKAHIEAALDLVQDAVSTLTRADWTLITDLADVLVIFEHSTKLVSSASYATITKVIPCIKLIDSKLREPKKAESPGSKKIRKALLERFSDRFDAYLHEHSIHSLATAFDPRMKAFVENDDTWKRLEEILLKEKPKVSEQQDTSNSPPPPAESPDFVAKRARKETLDDMFCSLGPLAKQLSHVEDASNTETVAVQLAAYRKCNHSSHEYPIDFWTGIGMKTYSLLWPMALRLLSIQATEVPSERSFSTAGLIFNDLRSKLSDEELNHLLFLTSNDEELKIEDFSSLMNI